MNFSHQHKEIRYISWKSPIQMRQSIISSYTRPLNNSNIKDIYTVSPRFIKSRKIISSNNNLRPLSRPIKHGRRQIISNIKSNSNKVKIQDVFDKPASYSITNNNCDKCENATIMDIYINKKIINPDNPCERSYPCKSRIRNITKISDNICTSTNQYLQSRIKTYEQNKNFHKISNNDYLSPPNNITIGSESFNSLHTPRYLSSFQNNNVDLSKSYYLNCNIIRVIYKPSNSSFITKDAVSSSTYTKSQTSSNKMNYFIVNHSLSTGESLNTKIINNVSNTWSYYNLITPKKTECVYHTRFGNHTRNFYTDPNKIEKNFLKRKKTITVKLQTNNKLPIINKPQKHELNYCNKKCII